MINSKRIEQIAYQIHKFMPKMICELSSNIEKKIIQILQTKLLNLDLVNREEFDIQKQILLRTREKLIILEHRLSKLENKNESA